MCQKFSVARDLGRSPLEFNRGQLHTGTLTYDIDVGVGEDGPMHV